MFVSPQGRKPKRRFPLPPGLLAAAAIFLILLRGLSALAQPATNPAAPAPAAAAPATTQESAAAGSATRDLSKDPSLWDLFKAGGYVMYALAGSSVLAVALIIERLYALRRNQVIPRGFLDGLKGVFRDPREDREAALRYCQSHDSPIARMVTAFVKRLPRGFDAAEKALEDAGGNEALKLRANMRFLYAIGSVATLLGLVGTIAGMIRAFQVTAKAGNADNKVELLSTGIYEAMVCTFGGLAVAIVVTLFYYFFVGRIERLVGDINDELSRFSDEYGLNAESPAELGVTAGMEGVR